jgi:hypothetical protein
MKQISVIVCLLVLSLALFWRLQYQ